MVASDGVPEEVPAKSPPIERPAERALTEPPPLPEPPSRGDQTTAEASVVLSEELGAPVHDLTEHVVPMTTEPMRRIARRRITQRRVMYVGAALAMFGAAALAVLIATSSELPKPVVTQRPAAVVSAPVVAPTPVVAVPKAEVVAAALAPAAPAEPAPAAVHVVPAHVVVDAPAPARKAIVHPVKKAAKPKYDPDALFFKGN